MRCGAEGARGGCARCPSGRDLPEGPWCFSRRAWNGHGAEKPGLGAHTAVPAGSGVTDRKAECGQEDVGICGSDSGTVLWDMLAPPKWRYTGAQALVKSRTVGWNVIYRPQLVLCIGIHADNIYLHKCCFGTVSTPRVQVLTHKFTRRGIYTTRLM